ncbi:hypothetical protein [Chryseobacterium sp. G0201]|uniref:hypothetical protein n=1 Tax=Chryseobacterium sp. G0201 TaxID=2487065 RepID=UPI000F50182D|nr:hypothetical protein [Chryseobacterium sp. G0201]AZA53441.1 hypothetical protein EG348_10670 [Chryseobacterium sp. G0201]
MSRTRIIKGRLTEIIEGDYDMYSSSNIIYNSSVEIREAGVERGITYGSPQYPPLAPQPIKLIVHFRPHKNWKGEFGFDWFRLGDTMLYRDVAFKDVVAYQYSDYQLTKLVDNSVNENVNKKNGYFKVDEEMLNELKKLYKPFTIPWKQTKNPAGKMVAEEYFVPWLSLLKDKEAKITFLADIKQEADYLEFPPSDYFTFTPNTIDIKGKKKISLNDFDIIIKCIKEFEIDQTIELKAFKKTEKGNLETVVGKLNVWANDVSKQKEKNVVFVKVFVQNLSGGIKPKPIIIDNEKERINQYLQQVYIKLSDQSDIIDLDLTNDKDFLNFITDNAVDYKKTFGYRSLDDYLKMKLEKDYPKKYSNHFKAFYFAEKGYGGPMSNLNGYSATNADFVVAFSTKDDQTVVHEFLHSMGLAHTFTNKYTDKNALFTYDYERTDNLMDYVSDTEKNKRNSLYYWQWKIANESIK